MSNYLVSNVDGVNVYTSPIYFNLKNVGSHKMEGNQVETINPEELETIREEMELRATSIAYYIGSLFPRLFAWVKRTFSATPQTERAIQREITEMKGIISRDLNKTVTYDLNEVLHYKTGSKEHIALQNCMARMRLAEKKLQQCSDPEIKDTLKELSIACVLPHRIPVGSLLHGNEIFISTENKMVLKSIIYHIFQHKFMPLEKFLHKGRCTLIEENYIYNLISMANTFLSKVDSLARQCIAEKKWTSDTMKLRYHRPSRELLVGETYLYGFENFHKYLIYKNCTKQIAAPISP